MADPYADIDPPRGPWVWLALGIYVVSFFVPFGAEGERILSGYHAFGYSLAMLVYGPLFGFTGDRVGWWWMIAIAGLPWLANPCYWWCLIAYADDQRRVAAILGGVSLGFGILGLPSWAGGLRFPAYGVWLVSFAIPLIGLALTSPRRGRRYACPPR